VNGRHADAVETARLLASELVTNAALFGRDPYAGRSVPAQFSLTLWHLPGMVVIEVSDCNPKPPVMRVADANADNGRGLMLVEALSAEWSYYFPRPGWKTVYCVIRLEAP
jgi:histidine kinase-like protein